MSAGQKLMSRRKFLAGSELLQARKPATVGILSSTALSAGVAFAVGLAPAPVQAQVVLDQTTGTWSIPAG